MQEKEILDKAIELIKRAGSFIMGEFTRIGQSDIEHKGFNDLVSYVDKRAEDILIKGLAEILPGSGFLAEEGTVADEKKEYTWIIDPLDGTTNFLHGLPVFGVSVALVRNNKLILGVVHELNRNEIFSAIKGQGAFCNGKRIYVSDKANLSEGLFATGFPYYDFNRMPQYLAILNVFMQKSHGLRRLGSAAVDLAYVACGRFEGFFEYNLNAWDVAAGALIVEEAGGKLTDFKGGDDYIFGREILAAPKAIHNQMLEVIKQQWL
jgi:myo-inositol-1(or 4)-monophosphatase